MIFILFMYHNFLSVLCATTANTPLKLQILHTNDMHSRFEETDKYGGMCAPNQFDCFGGFARVKQAVNDAKIEAKLAGYPSIFLNAGDSFLGTAYYTLLKWRAVAPLVDALGIDVMSLGNQEFYDGTDNLVQYLKHIKTPTVACNLNLTSEERLRIPILTSSYTINISNVTIGVIGYLTPETMEFSGNLKIYDEIPYLRAEARRFRRNGINIIIALGHSGFERDVQIVEAVPEISVIVGGHSHSLLYTPKENPPSVDSVVADYPYMVISKSGKKTPVVQAFCCTKYLGKLIVTFNDNGDVIAAEGNTILLDSTINKDPTVQKLVSDWFAKFEDKVNEVKGSTRVFLKRSQNTRVGRLESNLANLITDSFVDYGVQYAMKEHSHPWTDTPIAFLHYIGMRTSLDHMKNNGSITEGDISSLLPFQSNLCMVRYKGSTILKALEHAVSIETYPKHSFRFFLFASGLKVVYDLTKAPGTRVKSVTVLCGECSIPEYYPLKLDQVYSVIIGDYVAEGGDKFYMFKNERLNITRLGITDTDAFSMYLEKVKVVYPALEGRVLTEN